MSKNALLISDEILKERTVIHGNIDPKLLFPEIKVAQDMFIHPILGTALFDKIVNDINLSGTTTGDYKTLLDNYIIDPLLYYVLSSLPQALSFQFHNKGVLRKSGDNTDAPSMIELIEISETYKNRAEWYANRLLQYLKATASTTVLPEYLNPGTARDTINPDDSVFEMPIYLDSDHYFDIDGINNVIKL